MILVHEIPLHICAFSLGVLFSLVRFLVKKVNRLEIELYKLRLGK